MSRTDGCQVWGYDFSVTEFGPEVQDSPALLRRAHFKPYGLAGTNAHGADDVNKMYTLQSLMALNGHSHIDILKIDIESWEFETLNALIKSYVDEDKPLPFGQLQLEIHVWNMKFAEFLKWWEMLESAGLRPFWTEVRSYVSQLTSYLILCYPCSLTWCMRITTEEVLQNSLNIHSSTSAAQTFSFLTKSSTELIKFDMVHETRI